MQEHFLLTVQEAFTLRRLGVEVLPLIPFDRMPLEQRHAPIRFLVHLRRPDGIMHPIYARFTVPTCVSPDRSGYTCLLETMEKSDVPPGTEIWMTA
jgi:hypothetical protein